MREPCLLCDASFTSPDGLRAHYGREHHESLRSVETLYGPVCPQCGRTFTRLAVHASRTHGRSIAVLFWQARAAGDPHRVVAARVRLAMDVQLSDLESRLSALL